MTEAVLPSEPIALPPAPDGVAEIFGDAWGRVQDFAGLLADRGTILGVIGPREIPIIWDRHMVNSAALAPLLPDEGLVVDLGSGGGLPGVVLAAMRPDLEFDLVDTMERRCAWLTEVISELSLSNVTVTRARADELDGAREARAVTARAVAGLSKLVRMAAPMLGKGGVLLALKGQKASQELVEARQALKKMKMKDAEVLTMQPWAQGEATYVVRAWR